MPLEYKIMQFGIYKNILYLISKIYLSTVVLLQKMLLKFLVWEIYNTKLKFRSLSQELGIEIIVMVFHLAQTFQYDIEEIVNLKDYMHLQINHSQLNFKLAFIFQHHFSIY